MKHSHGRFLGALVGAAILLLAVAGPASAHVTVNPSTAPQGGYTKLTFRVPTESDTASTTKLQVQLPTDHPLASVSVKPHAGWSFTVTKSKLADPITTDDGEVTEAVSRIDWTANSPADAIKPGEFDEFDVSVGPLPKAPSLTFKALQTYSDGSVVRWIEVPTGGAEPEHPAPVLTLTSGDATDTAATAPDDASQGDDSSGDSDGGGKSTLALVLSALALIVAGGGAVVAVTGRRRAS